MTILSPTRRISEILLAAALAASPVASHDLYLEPSSFQALLGEPIAIGIGVGHAFAGAPLPYTTSLIESFATISPSGVRREVAGIEGVHPAGIVRFDETGRWSLVYHGRPWQQSLPPVHFTAYLTEVGRMDLAMTVDLSDETPIEEQVHRCARTLITVHSPAASEKTPVTPLQPASGEHTSDHGIQCGYDIEPINVDPNQNQGRVTVRIVRQGKPVKGARVQAWPPEEREHDHGHSHSHEQEIALPRIFQSDSNGIIEVPIDRSGRWILSSVDVARTEVASRSLPTWQSWWASVSFETVLPKLDHDSGTAITSRTD